MAVVPKFTEVLHVPDSRRRTYILSLWGQLRDVAEAAHLEWDSHGADLNSPVLEYARHQRRGLRVTYSMSKSAWPCAAALAFYLTSCGTNGPVALRPSASDPAPETLKFLGKSYQRLEGDELISATVGFQFIGGQQPSLLREVYNSNGFFENHTDWAVISAKYKIEEKEVCILVKDTFEPCRMLYHDNAGSYLISKIGRDGVTRNYVVRRYPSER